MLEYGVILGVIAVASIGVVLTLGGTLQDGFFSTTTTIADKLDADRRDRQPNESCQSLFESGRSTSGFYTLSVPNGTDLTIMCHMVQSGPLTGGWSVVAAQVEDATQPDWDDGIFPNRNQNSYFNTGFALSAQQLPPHSHVAFGRYINNTEILDAVAMTYTTGPLSHMSMASLLDPALQYDIHRDPDAHYAAHDPETGSLISDPEWNNTLTFDARTPAPGSEYTWSFSPNHSNSPNQGYAYGGTPLGGTIDLNTAWIVLVR